LCHLGDRKSKKKFDSAGESGVRHWQPAAAADGLPVGWLARRASFKFEQRKQQELVI
jgi:hypothetical protein